MAIMQRKIAIRTVCWTEQTDGFCVECKIAHTTSFCVGNRTHFDLAKLLDNAMEATCPILGNMFAKNILCGFKLTKERVECHKLVKASFVLWPLWQRTSRRVKGPVPCIQPGEVEEKFRFAFRVGDGFQSKVWANLCQHGDDQRFGTQGGHVRSMRKATQPHEAQVPRENSQNHSQTRPISRASLQDGNAMFQCHMWKKVKQLGQVKDIVGMQTLC